MNFSFLASYTVFGLLVGSFFIWASDYFRKGDRNQQRNWENPYWSFNGGLFVAVMHNQGFLASIIVSVIVIAVPTLIYGIFFDKEDKELARRDFDEWKNKKAKEDDSPSEETPESIDREETPGEGAKGENSEDGLTPGGK